MKKHKAICLKSYPDEDDLQEYIEGLIEWEDVRIYKKGKVYKVTEFFCPELYKLIKDK